MGQANRGTVQMRFQDGTVFQAWDDVSLRDTYIDPLGELTFTARPLRSQLDLYRNQLKKGELVSVLVNDAPQGVQLIQTVEKDIDRNGVTYKVTCNTPLVTAVQGSADPDYAFSSKSATSLSGVIGNILRPYGFEEVFIDAEDDVNIRAGKPVVKGQTKINVKALTAKDLQVHEGESAYGVVTRLVNDAGVCLRCDVGGRLILGKPRYDQPVAYTVVQDFNGQTKGDRMLDGIQIHDTNDDQFSECVVRGASQDSSEQTYAGRPRARYISSSSKTALASAPFTVPFSKVAVTTFTDARHTYRSDHGAAPYKPRILRDKMGGDATKCLGVAKLVIGMRASKAFVVTCEVDGWLSQSGRVWSVDTVGRVVIEADAFDSEMWLLERTLMMSRGGGQRTRLRWIPKDSLILGNSPE